MKTVFDLTGRNSKEARQRLECIRQQIQSLLDLSSDVLLVLNGEEFPGRNVIFLREEEEEQLTQILRDTKTYLSFFDYMTEETFRMIASSPSIPRDRIDTEIVSFLERKASLENCFFQAVFAYGMEPSDREKFDCMICLAALRRRKGTVCPDWIMNEITGLDERFAGEAQCLRDKDLQQALLYEKAEDGYWKYLTLRRELFEYHDILPDERTESDMILAKLIRFSRFHHIDRSYYCEAARRLIVDEEWERARRVVAEGLNASFPDDKEDRKEIWMLHYYRMILSERTDDAAAEADLLQQMMPDVMELLWDYDINSFAVASGEVYYRNGQYDLAEKAIRSQGEMIGRAMEIGEPIDLRMDLDEQFRILLLQAELRKRKDKNRWTVALAYGGCVWMIRYIHDCIEKRGFHLFSRITPADEQYVHEQLIQCGQDKMIAPTANDHQSDRFYTAMYK